MAFVHLSASDNQQINLAENPKLKSGGKSFTIILQLSIAAFTVALAWFSFVYYPQIVEKYANVGLPKTKVITEAQASGGFPIETSQYRIVYEKDSNTYYAFIEGENTAEFADNKHSSTITMKTVLSVASLCDLNVIYISTAELEVPQDLKNPASCR